MIPSSHFSWALNWYFNLFFTPRQRSPGWPSNSRRKVRSLAVSVDACPFSRLEIFLEVINCSCSVRKICSGILRKIFPILYHPESQQRVLSRIRYAACLWKQDNTGKSMTRSKTVSRYPESGPHPPFFLCQCTQILREFIEWLGLCFSVMDGLDTPQRARARLLDHRIYSLTENYLCKRSIIEKVKWFCGFVDDSRAFVVLSSR